MFMRYISHEIRTPLNSVYLGLQYLLAEEQDRGRGSPHRGQVLSVITDLQQACDSAIGVLSDMLTYDKIEDGVLQLDKTEFGVREFLDDIVHSFHLQVQYLPTVPYLSRSHRVALSPHYIRL
jgi:signal transduction histidine kinase